MTKVLFDHNMPPAIARSLHEMIKLDGHSAIPIRDKFSESIEDIPYFNELGKEGDWIVISKDLKNAKRKPERQALLKANIVAFYLAPSVARQKPNEQAATILWQWDKILQQRRNNKNGLFKLPIGKASKFETL